MGRISCKIKCDCFGGDSFDTELYFLVNLYFIQSLLFSSDFFCDEISGFIINIKVTFFGP